MLLTAGAAAGSSVARSGSLGRLEDPEAGSGGRSVPSLKACGGPCEVASIDKLRLRTLPGPAWSDKLRLRTLRCGGRGVWPPGGSGSDSRGRRSIRSA